MAYFFMKLIRLTGKYSDGKFAQVDDEDFDYLNQLTWHYSRTKAGFYVQGNLKFKNDKSPYFQFKTIYIHDLIVKKEKGQVVDHKDGNTLNNQKSNLRACTAQQNSRNTKKRKSRSVYKGVRFRKRRNPNCSDAWEAVINIDLNKRISLGRFPYTPYGEIQAAKAYNEAAIKYFGDFARINTILSEEQNH